MKHISNYTIDEFKELFKEFPYDIVTIVYDYYHRDKTYTVHANETSAYVKVAKKFLQDKDAPEGKALKYYLAMKE